MQAITDGATFSELSPAAAEITAYLRQTSEISDGPWHFDIGNVSDDRRSTYACFSRVSTNAPEKGKLTKDKLTVMASRQADGSWRLSHQLHRAP